MREMFWRAVLVFLVVQVSGTAATSVLSPYIDRLLTQALTTTNTLSLSFPKAYYTCPKYETHVPGRVMLNIPCGSMHASLPGQGSHTSAWVLSPTIPGVWINITLLELRAVYSFPRCHEQYFMLRNPKSVRRMLVLR